jgi:hypothetical protein
VIDSIEATVGIYRATLIASVLSGRRARAGHHLPVIA